MNISKILLSFLKKSNEETNITLKEVISYEFKAMFSDYYINVIF